MGLALTGNLVEFLGGMAVSVGMQHTGIVVSKQMLEPLPWPTGLETGVVRFVGSQPNDRWETKRSD
jgi:hypothetical protein